MSKLKINILADNNHKITKGLMFTDSLPQDECAFFIFPYAGKHAFWNKNVPYAIDVGFYDNAGKLVHVGCLEAQQEQPIAPPTSIKYVLETNKGWFEHNGVDVGTHLWNVIDIGDK
jgi:uncharacterized membrane protein (UPF0127 family)